jgi:hydrogenase maturation factor
LIASGALLLAVASADADKVKAALDEEGIAAACIGRVVRPERGISLHSGGAERPMPRFERDEIARLFG